MELTTDWRRQATRAAGVTALAPAVLLGAAVLLAAGAGFGGIGSLGQIAGGPSVPSVDQGTPTSAGAKRSAPPRSPVVALAPTPNATATATDGPAAQGGSGTGGGASPQRRATVPTGQRQSPGATTPGVRTPTRTPTPTAPSTPQTGSTPGNAQTAPSNPQTPSLPQTPQVPSTPGPVQQLLDIPRGLTNSLPDPVGPLTNRVLDTVNGLLPR